MQRLAATTVVLAMTLVPILGTAWGAQAMVTMTREESKPRRSRSRLVRRSAVSTVPVALRTWNSPAPKGSTSISARRDA